MKTYIVCSSSSGTQARRMHVAAELAVRRLRPERKQEIAEPPVGLSGPASR